MSNPQVVFTTAQLGRLVGYSTQQVRDLERLQVIPTAERRANGYRRYRCRHAVALRAYRDLAVAIGPVAARALMPRLVDASGELAAERIDDLHADIAAERRRVREALQGLAAVVRDSADVLDAADAMSITELSQALAVRASALRHWEREGLVHPERASVARSYGAVAITEARVTASLRAGGYGIPAIAGILEGVREHGITADAERVLTERLTALTRRSVALLASSASLHELLSERD